MMKSFFEQYIDKDLTKNDNPGLIQKPISYQILGKKNLPTIPQILMKLINVSYQKKAGIQEISNIIKWDPALTYKILGMAHSTSHAVPKNASSLEAAVAKVGIKTVHELVISAATNAAFEPKSFNSIFNLTVIWEHSVKSALLAQIISEEVHYQNPEVAYLTALLHDIGKLILFSNFPDIYTELLSSQYDPEAFYLVEDNRMGINHCKIAAYLIDQWNFHSFSADAIFYHHYPVEKVIHSSPLVKIVYIANLLAVKNDQENKKRALIIKDLMGFDEHQVAEFLNDADMRLREAIHFLDMDSESFKNLQEDSDHHLAIHRAILKEVRDVSLIAVALQPVYQAGGRDAILKAVKQSLQKIIDVSDILFFFYSSEEDTLLSLYLDGDGASKKLENIYIPMHLDSSIIVSSLLKDAPVDSFTHSEYSELIILDSQILHFLGKEGILCLPMLNEGVFVGVIVLGIDRIELPFFTSKAKILKRFIRQVSSILKKDQIRQDRINRSNSEALETSILRTRKIVHEINNPLSIIKNYLKVLKMRLDEENIAHDEIGIINEEINRIRDMLGTLTGSAARTVSKDDSVNINSLISDLVKLTNGSLTEQSGIEIHLDTDPSIPESKIQKDGVKQVLMNLIKNATEAMPEGGNIFIKTRYIQAYIEDGMEAESGGSGGMIEISIADDGPGIPNGKKAALFDPFVTSREGHNGLGLSIVSDLINRMNGSIDYKSDKGKGTSFNIKLPLVTS